MITGRSRFNLYLLVLFAGLFACGCQSGKKDGKEKQVSTLRVHLAATPSDESRSVKVEIYRASPVTITLANEPFLTEAHITEANIVEVPGGGFDLVVRFDRQGTWLLEQYSATNPGRRYAVFSQFGKNGKQHRWLAAPAFSRLISNGALRFAPDASREEAEEIVLGLNNVAKKVEQRNKW